MRTRKYTPGLKLSIVELIGNIEAGRYVLENGKPAHPGFMASRKLSDLMNRCRRGMIADAIPNPEHPDFEEGIK